MPLWWYAATRGGVEGRLSGIKGDEEEKKWAVYGRN